MGLGRGQDINCLGHLAVANNLDQELCTRSVNRRGKKLRIGFGNRKLCYQVRQALLPLEGEVLSLLE